MQLVHLSSKVIEFGPVGFVRVYPRWIVFSTEAYSVVCPRWMLRYVSELRSLPIVETCPFMYPNRQLVSNGVNPVLVTALLHVAHLVDRQCWSRHAAQKHLITGEISSTDLSFKLWQRDVLHFHVAALVIDDAIFCLGLIECVSVALGTCLRV